jgi:membrane protease YdiL (CAAX protease family)
MRGYLWNADEHRLRAPLRLVAATVVFVVVVFVSLTAFVRAIVAAGVVEPDALGTGAELTSETLAIFSGSLVVTGVAVVLSLLIVARYVDRRRLSDYGFRVDRRWWSDFAFGLVLGAVLPTLILAVGLAAGWYRITGFFASEAGFATAFVSVVVLFVSVGVYEEVLVRGWLLTNVAEGLGFVGERAAVAVAVSLTSALFGVLHLPNPGASLASAAVITLAGVFLALGYVVTGELAVPIGIHITWNLFKGSVYGVGVSGLRLPVTVVETEAVGPEYVTGGDFGPEAGLLGAAAVVVGTAAILWWVRWRDGETSIHERLTTPDLRFDLEA